MRITLPAEVWRCIVTTTKPQPSAAFIPCYKCVFCGKLGKDSREQPIAWCHLQQLVVAPEVGCAEARTESAA